MKIDVVFVTYNRLEFTRLALASILADDNPDLRITIWDNASNDGTAEFLKAEARDPRIREVILSPTNIGQIAATNEVWKRSQADLLGKLDNDCLLPKGWSATLAGAHADIENLGAVACWHFFADDFDGDRAKHKIVALGKHRILRHPWTCGTGFLIKRRTFQEQGPVEGKAMTQFFLRLAAAGLVNGFYYPLLFQEHMDDPKSSHCQTNTREALEATARTVRQQTALMTDPQARMALRQRMLNNLIEGPYDPSHYLGWREKLRKLWRTAKRPFHRAQMQT